jgi:hypothetical protein
MTGQCRLRSGGRLAQLSERLREPPATGPSHRLEHSDLGRLEPEEQGAGGQGQRGHER